MGHDWIIHVLTDVRRFARQNDMPLLSSQLDDAILIANTEMVQRDARRPSYADQNIGPVDPHPAE